MKSFRAGSLTAAQSCHLRELDLCSATLLLFNQNPSGVATTDNELDKQCGFLGEAQQCFKNFTNRLVMHVPQLERFLPRSRSSSAAHNFANFFDHFPDHEFLGNFFLWHVRSKSLKNKFMNSRSARTRATENPRVVR